MHLRSHRLAALLLILTSPGCYQSHEGDGRPAPEGTIDEASVGARFAFFRARDHEPASGRTDPTLNSLMYLELGRSVQVLDERALDQTYRGLVTRRVPATGSWVGAAWTSDEQTIVFQGDRGAIATLPHSAPIHLGADGTIASLLEDEIARYDFTGAELGRTVVEDARWAAVDAEREVAVFFGRDVSTLRVIDLSGGSPERVVGAITPDDASHISAHQAWATDRYVLAAVELIDLWTLHGPLETQLWVIPRVGAPVARRLNLEELTVVTFDRCRERLLALSPQGAVVAINPADGAVEQVGAAAGLAPDQHRHRPFASFAALSPDARHLLWLANGAEHGLGRRLVVHDLARHTVADVDAEDIQGPALCEGTPRPARPSEPGNFAGGYFAINMSGDTCALPGGPPTPTRAYRLRLESPALEERSHCGRSIPWVLEDGSMLTCEPRADGAVQLTWTDPEGLRSTPVTHGPWDVNAQPVDLDRGCAAP